MSRTGLLLFLGLPLLAAVGCGAREYSVPGEVRFADGQPLARGQVVLESAELKVGGGASLTSDGTFTTSPLPAGTYRVYLVDARDPPPPGALEGKLIIHKRFTDPATSGLTFEVGKQQRLEIVVERP